jgi:hypothetical protein
MDTGYLAELPTPEDLLRAVRALQGRGYRRIDAFTPYPVQGLEEALYLPRSPLNWCVLPIALAGAGIGYLLQYWCNGVDYPLDVGGRPLHSAPAFIPITFESGVLAASLTACFVWLLLCHLPQLYSPLFDVPGFERASIDRFWVGVDERDPWFNEVQTERDLRDVGALSVARAHRRSR